MLVATLVACVAFAAAASAAPRAATAAPAGAAAPRIDPSGPHGACGSTSLNWSGYSATGGPFTSVTATWTQPAVVPRSREHYAAFWVGIDGDGSNTVEQIGTLGYTSGGHSYYEAWFELYPGPMHPITNLLIRPGDVVTATVDWTGGAWFKLTLMDQTTGKRFVSPPQSSSGARQASAEIIVEAPADGAGVLPLARFGLAAFTECAIDGEPLTAAGVSAIDMVTSGGKLKTATSALSADGAGFTVSDDFTAPTVTAKGLQRRATSGWTNAPVHVSLKGSDGTGGSGVAAVYYTLDGGATQTCSHALRVSGAGSHVVKYWAVDRAGNTGGKRTRYVNLDLATPVSAPGAVDVTRAGVRRGARLAVPVAVTDALPTSGSVTLVTRIVAASGRTLAKAIRTGVRVNATKTVHVRLTSSLPKGIYSLRTRVTDAAGNVQARAGRATLTVR